MTKIEFLEGKKLNLIDYVNNCKDGLNNGTITGRNIIARTKKTIKRAEETLKNINNNNYWNAETEYYFNSLYKDMELKNRKEDISLF